MAEPLKISRARVQEGLRIPCRSVELIGDLVIPAMATGLVVFAHGSGSSRQSPRNRVVAAELNAAGLGTLLFDLLSQEEEIEDEQTRQYRFDIGLLAARLVVVTDWLVEDQQLHLPIGYFGASTGAAAALVAATDRPRLIKAVVSRGGRPDLAMPVLHRVQAPTLLLVGERDPMVWDLNREALHQLPASLPKALVMVPGASHLFEEAGTLARVAADAAHWYTRWLP